jgi:hypothetical protein
MGFLKYKSKEKRQFLLDPASGLIRVFPEEGTASSA